MKINKKEQEIVLKANPKKKYEYFTIKIADYEEVWGLFDNGWAMSGDDAGHEYFSFWPRKEFAEINAVGAWDGYKARSIDLDEFLDEWIPGIRKDGYDIAVFWHAGESIKVRPDQLKEDLEEELELYDF